MATESFSRCVHAQQLPAFIFFQHPFAISVCHFLRSMSVRESARVTKCSANSSACPRDTSRNMPSTGRVPLSTLQFIYFNGSIFQQIVNQPTLDLITKRSSHLTDELNSRFPPRVVQKFVIRGKPSPRLVGTNKRSIVGQVRFITSNPWPRSAKYSLSAAN